MRAIQDVLPSAFSLWLAHNNQGWDKKKLGIQVLYVAGSHHLLPPRGHNNGKLEVGSELGLEFRPSNMDVGVLTNI